MRRKGWIIIGAVVGVFLLLLIGMGALAIAALGRYGGGREWTERRVEGEGQQKVALVRVSGEITGGHSDTGLGGSAGARDIIGQLRQADEDGSVAAIVLRLETPGGAVVASDEIYRELRRVGRRKPIVASMGEEAASGGYYLASATRTIVADPSTATGSIGVILILANLQGTAAKLGVKPVVIKSGAFKDAGSPFRDLTPEEQAYFQHMIDQSYEQFLTAVAVGRHRPIDQIRPLADGRVFSGEDAKANGLVDELGDVETAYADALHLAQLDRSEARLVEYEAPPSLVSLLRPALRSPVDEARQELGIGSGLMYLWLPGV